MAKKRKARRPNIPMQTGPVPREAPASPGERAEPRKSAAYIPPPARTGVAATPIKMDYTFVVNDLKRIALIGGGLMVVLVVLSFIIR